MFLIHLGKDSKWLKIIDLDPEMLAYTVELDESVIICDPETGKIILMVLRNFCSDENILEWADVIVQENLAVCNRTRVLQFTRLVYYNLTPAVSSVMTQATLFSLGIPQVYQVQWSLTGQGTSERSWTPKLSRNSTTMQA